MCRDTLPRRGPTCVKSCPDPAKVEVDAVFFPHRLRTLLLAHSEASACPTLVAIMSGLVAPEVFAHKLHGVLSYNA